VRSNGISRAAGPFLIFKYNIAIKELEMTRLTTCNTSSFSKLFLDVEGQGIRWDWSVRIDKVDKKKKRYIVEFMDGIPQEMEKKFIDMGFSKF
jgi:hypothetical protein